MTTGPALWPDLPADHPFSAATLPYGIATVDGHDRVVVRLGDEILDLAPLAATAGMPESLVAAWSMPSLNAFLDLGHDSWTHARERLITHLEWARPEAVRRYLRDIGSVTLRMPINVSDYVSFYASQHHASNIGRILRPDADPLPANWRHLPHGHHGRSGAVVISSTPVRRPIGQSQPEANGTQRFGPSVALDIEAELGFIVGGPTNHGDQVDVDDAGRHVLGAVLLNDWSARDIQAWECVPLGPFLGKSFATSISPWVIPMAALESARIPLQQNDPAPLPYLTGSFPARTIGVQLGIELNGTTVSEPNYADMYWSPEQMVAHLTVNGARLRSGDLLGSGTISGPQPGQRGSLVELTWNGAEPLRLDDGSSRTFLQDGDTVTITGWAAGPDGARIGFGEVAGTILPPARNAARRRPVKIVAA